ncbi:Bordetella uptake gene [Candidatus Planktophila versatilis]|uniref:Bug family tripartite tricarboxylate transporter substrate binding protein n=1 Tax=Candidatus Planktophila versatilis TaxID=1884905 RepID=UPI003BEEF537
MFKKKVIALGVLAIAASLLAAPTANAGAKPASKAKVGDECLRAGVIAAGRGVNGTDLTCAKVAAGTFAGTLRWWYPEMKPYGSVEWVSSSNIGGGYGTTAIAIGDAMKKEGLLTDYTVTYRSNAPLGLGYFYDQKNRKDLLLITGFAMPGGLATNGSKLSITSASAVAGVMREAEAFVVPTSSKYKTINDLLADIKANPKTVAIGGGNYGGVDHVTVATVAETLGVKALDLNYIPYSGGGTLVPDVISGRVAVGISGTSEFSSYVAAGKMRVLAVTSPAPLKTIKGKTLVQQGVDLTFGNWRGILAPADLSAAELLNTVKVIDALHSTKSWKDTLVAKSWIDEYRSGDAFTKWIKTENQSIMNILTDFKLIK